MSYTDYLASRGYRRIVIERTHKVAGDVVLPSATKPAERIPEEEQTVVAIRRKAVAGGKSRG